MNDELNEKIEELNEEIEELNEEIEELKKELQQYSNELDKLYSSNPQKMIKTFEEINNDKKGLEQKIIVLKKEKKELEQNIKDIEMKNTINNEYAHAVHILKTKYPKKCEIFEKVKNSEFKEEDYNLDKEVFDKEGFDKEGFDKSGINKYTTTKYNFNGFDKEGFDKEGFDKEGFNKDTKNKYDPNGFDKYAKHKDTNTFLDKEKNIRKDILININWLEDRDKFLELYDKIIENGEIIVNIENDTISSDVLKDFLEDILSGDIKYKDLEHYKEDINNIKKKKFNKK